MQMNRVVMAVCVALSMAASGVRAEDMKIGVVDLQRALNEVEEGAVAKAALKKEFDLKQKQLDDKQNELKSLKEELDNRGTLMKDDVKQAKVGELQRKLAETQQLYMGLQQDLSKREGEMTQGIFQKMGVVVQSMAADGNYTLILERTAVPYFKPALDVTNELIRRYNDAYKSKKK
jgi:outer membrane protein